MPRLERERPARPLPDGLVEQVLHPEVVTHEDQSLLDLHVLLPATPLVLSDEGAGVGVSPEHAYRLGVRNRRGYPLLAPGLGVVPVHLPSFPLEDKTYVPDVAKSKRLRQTLRADRFRSGCCGNCHLTYRGPL